MQSRQSRPPEPGIYLAQQTERRRNRAGDVKRREENGFSTGPGPVGTPGLAFVKFLIIFELLQTPPPPPPRPPAYPYSLCKECVCFAGFSNTFIVMACMCVCACICVRGTGVLGWGSRFCFSFQCCFTCTETTRLIRDGEPKTATSTSTQLLSSDTTTGIVSVLLYAHRNHQAY